jgi:hypothetical protein
MEDFTAWVEKNKALWTRVHDEVIQPDLEKEWKTSKQGPTRDDTLLTTRQERRNTQRN